MMKNQLLIQIFFLLLGQKKVPAQKIAEKYNISVRSVYRYVDELTISGIPIDVMRGRNGGIYISEEYRLPTGFLTKEEYKAILQALNAFNAEINDDVFSSAITKISSKLKNERQENSLSGNVLIDSGTWGDSTRFSDKLHFLEKIIEERKVLKIEYIDRNGEQTNRAIEPHLLVLKQNIWYVFAYCHLRKEFRLFKIGRIKTMYTTNEFFIKRPFKKEDIPLQFWNNKQKNIEVTLEISSDILADAEEWLGLDCISKKGDKFYANICLPDDNTLVSKILSMGKGVKVITPKSLQERVFSCAKEIFSIYE